MLKNNRGFNPIILIFVFMVIIIGLAAISTTIQKEEEQPPTANTNINFNTNENTEVDPYLADPLYCETNDDCTTHVTSCSACACAEAVNKQSVTARKCAPLEGEQPLCDAYCPTVLKCLNNTCRLLYFNEVANKVGERFQFNARLIGGDEVMEHPIINLEKNQQYANTPSRQIILVSDEVIDCPRNDEISLTGIVNYIAPQGEVGKKSYEGYYIDVEDWQCDQVEKIIMSMPRPNQSITSPLAIMGRAVGFWYFEGDFPVKLYDANNVLLASGIATAQDEWMTEDFVAFESSLEFDSPDTDYGWLILERDNPSGLPANADELRIMVNFE